MSRELPILLLAFSLAACGQVPDWTVAAVRPVEGVPDRFTPPPVPEGSVVTGCLSPLTDPRDGFTIRMLRSKSDASAAIGDYEVTGGRYGVGPDEALRVDCRTWRAVGVVRR